MSQYIVSIIRTKHISYTLIFKIQQAEATSPRVIEVRSRYSIGTKISKAFDGIEYSGKVIRDNGRYYQVEYKDGYEEDMTHTKLR